MRFELITKQGVMDTADKIIDLETAARHHAYDGWVIRDTKEDVVLERNGLKALGLTIQMEEKWKNTGWAKSLKKTKSLRVQILEIEIETLKKQIEMRNLTQEQEVV